MEKSIAHARRKRQGPVIFDVLYGFVPITEWEEKIINSPFFQRLRWIKQLGFANYIFPGAEHNRFAHAVGVMASMQEMIRSLQIGVPDHELFDPKSTNQAALLHKSLRIAALLHDIGTFPFSHAIEFAYIRHGTPKKKGKKPVKSNGKKPKDLPNSHEHLGSFIIKNTDYPGGITRILQDYNLDVNLISKIIKGDSPYLFANQLMHSDLDADRMDYLIRDAHYTGIKYGQFDRDYVLANLITYKVGKNQTGFGVQESALHAVEDFLLSRFNWYSQVIKNPGSAKFDIMSSHLAKAFLEKDLLFQFHDLLSMIENKGERFFWWNDTYFITKCQDIRYKGLIKDPRIRELNEMLLYRTPPKTINHPTLKPRMLSVKGNHSEQKKLTSKIEDLVVQFNAAIEKKGTGKEWILVDLPEKPVSLTTGFEHLVKKRSSDNLLQERDPIKIVDRKGSVKLLVEEENSLMNRLAGQVKYVPAIYANEPAIRLLRQCKLI